MDTEFLFITTVPRIRVDYESRTKDLGKFFDPVNRSNLPFPNTPLVSEEPSTGFKVLITYLSFSTQTLEQLSLSFFTSFFLTVYSFVVSLFYFVCL